MNVTEEMKEALEETIELHRMALASGDEQDYTDMKCIHNDRQCPLCEYSRAQRTEEEEWDAVDICVHCPWMLIEGCECESEDSYDFSDDLDFRDNDEASIERLQGWLVGKPYVLGVVDE